MPGDFPDVTWDARLEQDCRALIEIAIDEDLENQLDWTTIALVDDEARGGAKVVARAAGVAAGLRAVDLIIECTQAELTWRPELEDGQQLAAGQTLGQVEGNARDLLTLERTILNFLGPLCGIATLAHQYARLVEGTGARVYDTRKTTPGWRRLEKYAARCGGAHNHRLGLNAAVMIKDNHIAHWIAQGGTLASAVHAARQLVADALGSTSGLRPLLIEIEVDSIEQLREVLVAEPDIVLLDNMPIPRLVEAVATRNQLAPGVELEASGGVNLANVAEIARTGVERISVGAITHSATSLDIGLDWMDAPTNGSR